MRAPLAAGDGSDALLKRGFAWALLGGLALLLGGCAAAEVVPPVALAATVEGISLNQSGKTASDHIVSLITGEDCSVLRYTKTGKYCLTAAEIARQNAMLHRPYEGTCYRLRSGVTCYTEADATHTSETDVYIP